MGRRWRTCGLFILLSAAVLPAHADPMLMFLLGLARNMIETSLASRPARPPLAMPEMPPTYPGTVVQPEHLRRLIDDCFTYLSSSQRAELFEALHSGLLERRNAAVRGEMIQYFAQTALQVRAVQLRLAQLGAQEKALLAEEFGRTAGELPAAERAQLREILRRGLLPVPSDLAAMLAEQLEKNAAPIPVAESAYERPTTPVR